MGRDRIRDRVWFAGANCLVVVRENRLKCMRDSLNIRFNCWPCLPAAACVWITFSGSGLEELKVIAYRLSTVGATSASVSVRLREHEFNTTTTTTGTTRTTLLAFINHHLVHVMLLPVCRQNGCQATAAATCSIVRTP